MHIIKDDEIKNCLNLIEHMEKLALDKKFIFDICNIIIFIKFNFIGFL